MTQTQTLKKVEYAVGATGLFIRHLHRENFDRGMIATFGNTFRVEQTFTASESRLHSALARVARSVTNEGTRLYDSIEDVIREFWRIGERDRPWLLTIITDGIDNVENEKYRGNPAGIGRYVATYYNHEDSNFISVIGVGDGEQIDRKALGTLGDTGGFPAMTIDVFPLLEMLFISIALEVSERLEGIRINYEDMSWTEVSRVRQLSRIPFDYAFLLDRSGSMSEPG